MPQTTNPALSGRREVERRGQKRFDLALNLRYTISSRKRDIHGAGRTINISSSGVLFRSSGYPNTGRHIDLWIDWPTTDANGRQLTLHISGFIVRSQGHRIAVSISRYQLIPATPAAEEPEQTPAARQLWKTPSPSRVYRSPQHSGIFLIVEEGRDAAAFAAILGKRGYPVEIAAPEEARKILLAGAPPVRLLVTNTLDILNGLKLRVPVVYTTAQGAPQPAADDPETIVAVLRKPLIYGEIRKVLDRLLPAAEVSGDE